MLAIEDAVTHVEAGFEVLEFTNELDIIVGHVRVTGIDQTGMSFEQLFFGAVNIGACKGEIRINIRHRQVSNYVKPMIVCPDCDREVQSIFLVAAQWACRGCHDLIYVAQRLSPLQRTIVERDRLSKKLADEPGHDRNERRRERRRLAALREQIGSVDDVLPQQLRYRVRGRWLRQEEQPKSEVTAEDIHYGWKPIQERGFHALRQAEPEGGR